MDYESIAIRYHFVIKRIEDCQDVTENIIHSRMKISQNIRGHPPRKDNSLAKLEIYPTDSSCEFVSNINVCLWHLKLPIHTPKYGIYSYLSMFPIWHHALQSA